MIDGGNAVLCSISIYGSNKYLQVKYTLYVDKFEFFQMQKSPHWEFQLVNMLKRKKCDKAPFKN